MKKLILISILFILGTCQFAHAQTTVAVTQGFLDDANAAFRELVTLRAANTTLLKANDALTEANKANAAATASLLIANETLKSDNADLRKLKCDKGSLFFIVYRWTKCK